MSLERVREVIKMQFQTHLGQLQIETHNLVLCAHTMSVRFKYRHANK